MPVRKEIDWLNELVLQGLRFKFTDRLQKLILRWIQRGYIGVVAPPFQIPLHQGSLQRLLKVPKAGEKGERIFLPTRRHTSSLPPPAFLPCPRGREAPESCLMHWDWVYLRTSTAAAGMDREFPFFVCHRARQGVWGGELLSSHPVAAFPSPTEIRPHSAQLAVELLCP